MPNGAVSTASQYGSAGAGPVRLPRSIAPPPASSGSTCMRIAGSPGVGPGRSTAPTPTRFATIGRLVWNRSPTSAPARQVVPVSKTFFSRLPMCGQGAATTAGFHRMVPRKPTAGPPKVPPPDPLGSVTTVAYDPRSYDLGDTSVVSANLPYDMATCAH